MFVLHKPKRWWNASLWGDGGAEYISVKVRRTTWGFWVWGALLQKYKHELQSLGRGDLIVLHIQICCAWAVTAETAVRVQILTHISARAPFTSYNESDSVRASGHLNIWFSRETRTAHVRHFILCLSNSRTMLVFTSFSLDPHVSLSVEDYWGNFTLVFCQRQHTTHFGRTLNFSKRVCIRRKFLGWTT